jgi:hypothetical protein
MLLSFLDFGDKQLEVGVFVFFKRLEPYRIRKQRTTKQRRVEMNGFWLAFQAGLLFVNQLTAAS